MKDEGRKMLTKGLKPLGGGRPDAAEAMRIAAAVAPGAPPAVVETAPTYNETPVVVSLRITEHTATMLAQEANRQGITQRVLLCRALAAAGLDVAPDDLRERTPPRRRAPGQRAP
jgi:hypothetical protein